MTDMKKSPLAPVGGFPDLAPIDGVRFATSAAAIKYAGRDDVMLAELAPGTVVAGVFTRSSTCSAAVLDCQEKLGGAASGGAAILVNSGNANAFTGSYGRTSVTALTQQVAQLLDVDVDRVFTASTGVIGEPLPHERIIDKLADLGGNLAVSNLPRAARAIMTTDTFAKGAGETLVTGAGDIHISGFAKGSGMIAPDMATMLAYVFTDARIAQPLLQDMVTRAVAETFNCITVDSDTSTSDTLMVCATMRSTAPLIEDAQQGQGPAFYADLRSVMLDLAQQVVRDGEGASKFVEVAVVGATSDGDARKVALSIANSPLVKTAIAGEDPNWGRIVMAVGKSGATANRDRLSIRFGDIMVAEQGWVSPGYSEAAGVAYMQRQDLEITVDLGIGDGRATVWTCDLTHGYIQINADYRS